MARGEYCAKHGRYFGNILPCPQCRNEFYTESMESLAIADGWSDPCGRAMNPLMESTLQDLVASGPADNEYQRLLQIERLAKVVIQAQLALETPAFLKALESLRTALQGSEG